MPQRFSPLKLYQELEFDDLWEDAEIPAVLEYISGNKHLRIPPEWKDHLRP